MNKNSMAKQSYLDCPQVLRDYLFYLETIKGRSPRTVNGYYVDLRTFFRFLKVHRGLVKNDADFTEISIQDLSIEDLRTVHLSEAYEFLHYVSSARSNAAVTRSRKVSSLRGFFKYLTNNRNLLAEDPLKNLEVPSAKKALPKYLTLEQTFELLNSVEPGDFQTRDYCILTFFLNCGMRLSELVGINLSDIRDNTLRLLGKGNKERVVYLNDACLNALSAYLPDRRQVAGSRDQNALFLTRNGTRIGARWVEKIVERCLQKAGLAHKGLSPHKLRHTAATIMYQHGNVDIRVLKEILGHTNVGTTEIYTHVSNKQMEQAAGSTPLSHMKAPQKNDKKRTDAE